MSITSVLVDTAHAEYESATGPRVNGITPKAPATSAQFNCRASKPTTSELSNDQIQFSQYQRDVTLLTEAVYADGVTPLAIDETWRIVIEAGPFAGEYVLLGEPEVIRKRDINDLIGYIIALRHYDREGV